jgi:hypothetical protein
MNALANDQALRLTQLLTSHPALRPVTAALYTGEQESRRTSVTGEGLITDRTIIQDTAPDILLTNYKMLDQNPLAHRLGRTDAQLLRNRPDRSPLRVVVRGHLRDHPHRPLPQLRRVVLGPTCHDSISSQESPDTPGGFTRTGLGLIGYDSRNWPRDDGGCR